MLAIAVDELFGMSEERLDWHLSNWAEFMRHDKSPGHYPAKACGGIRGTGGREFDDMVAAADIRCAEAVQAIIGSMDKRHEDAMHCVHLGKRWLWITQLCVAYDEGRDRVRKGLSVRCIK